MLKSAFDPRTASDLTAASLATMPAVVSRVSRFSYGVELGDLVSIANPPADRTKDTFYTEPDGSERVRRMRWYLKQVRCRTPTLPPPTLPTSCQPDKLTPRRPRRPPCRTIPSPTRRQSPTSSRSAWRTAAR